MNYKTFTVRDFSIRLFGLIGIGWVAAIIGGIISGWISAWVDWGVGHFFYQELNIMRFSIPDYVEGEIMTMSMPLSILIGTSMGFSNTIFRTSKTSPLIWAIIACLGTILGLFFSQLSERHVILQLATYFQVAIIGFITGSIASWAIRLYILRNDDETQKVKKSHLTVGLFSNLLFIFVTTYYYFELLNYARNIPS